MNTEYKGASLINQRCQEPARILALSTEVKNEY